ncbi:MAG: TraR/DksA family transcriptional regulator [Planctomycetes bacterium]|nr:TraR/DksA family transcriptional regulator [Planctomycetota bacterium]
MARRDALLKLHQTLSSRRTELRKRLGMELADLGHTKQNSTAGDSADAAFDSSGEELASQLAELESRELQQIERAVKRLKTGVYGLCEICSCKIPVARLNALPYSTLCIKCQREMEHDANWLQARGSADWNKVSDGDSGMDDRVVNLSELEMDFSK